MEWNIIYVPYQPAVNRSRVRAFYWLVETACRLAKILVLVWFVLHISRIGPHTYSYKSLEPPCSMKLVLAIPRFWLRPDHKCHAGDKPWINATLRQRWTRDGDGDDLVRSRSRCWWPTTCFSDRSRHRTCIGKVHLFAWSDRAGCCRCWGHMRRKLL